MATKSTTSVVAIHELRARQMDERADMAIVTSNSHTTFLGMKSRIWTPFCLISLSIAGTVGFVMSYVVV